MSYIYNQMSYNLVYHIIYHVSFIIFHLSFFNFSCIIYIYISYPYYISPIYTHYEHIFSSIQALTHQTFLSRPRPRKNVQDLGELPEVGLKIHGLKHGEFNASPMGYSYDIMAI